MGKKNLSREMAEYSDDDLSRRMWGPTPMNGGRVMLADEFGGACRAAGMSDCRYQPNATRHTCRQSDAARWQCATSRLARAVVATAMMETVPAKISPEHVDYKRLVRMVVDAMKETQQEYERLPAVARFVPTQRIRLTCLHAMRTYDVFRVLDYLRDVTLAHRPDLTSGQEKELDEAWEARDARRLSRITEIALPERDRRLLHLRLSEWAEAVSRSAVPPESTVYSLVKAILDERSNRRTGASPSDAAAPPAKSAERPPAPTSPSVSSSAEMFDDVYYESEGTSNEHVPESENAEGTSNEHVSGSEYDEGDSMVDDDDDDVGTNTSDVVARPLTRSVVKEKATAPKRVTYSERFSNDRDEAPRSKRATLPSIRRNGRG